MFYKNGSLLDSNPGPLVLEATTLQNVSQPLILLGQAIAKYVQVYAYSYSKFLAIIYKFLPDFSP